MTFGTFPRARAIRTLVVLALGPGLAGCGRPSPSSDTLTLLAPAAPGGGWDQTARVMQQVFRSTGLSGKAQVVNVPGAGGVIGLAQVVNAHRGDPHVLMMTGLIMMGAILTNKSPVTMDQVTPLARLLGEHEVLVVPADSPYRTLADFVKAWKADPGALAIAGGSAGGTDHMLAGLLALAAGVDVTKLNYLPHSGGGESLASLLGSHVAAGINGYAELIPFIEAGRLRALAISSEERLAGLNVATFREQGVEVSLANWRAVAAPPGITNEQRSRLVALLDQLHGSEAWKEALRRNNWIDLYLTGAEYETFLKTENERVAAVLKSIGLVN
ncbi:MAG: tripartite tricarboxylate transporter substrate binding protein [Vicinamibacteria bacterium]|nr:tripartite tricarboxylate transporter substrate binding protein [Vicinamibacteria bacterium]